ncbi:siderophore-interacting protein [Lysinibacter sp. HNR]|uniref:siderophore-interacting protein n=1 Tax=Lysinibacter sp. HNR TaxID=3031408 RepID=UPI002435FB49|nr:siderophore-interacting protein [Lysinibacter sp. HNR]WGD37660.1 siderophore-interacting protein [Lysinibacter sp. HNR]
MHTREHVRYDLALRRLAVFSIHDVVPGIRSITLAGSDLNDFVSDGPTDHAKVFFPDPATGQLNAPWIAEDGGIQRPDSGVSISRDYTPLRYVPATPERPASIDIEFVLHENPGPATSWALGAAVGDEVVVGGPRGSALAPTDSPEAILIADETALPSLTRWLQLLPSQTGVSAILLTENEDFDPYLSNPLQPPTLHTRASVERLYREDGPGQLLEAVRSISIGQDTYVWAAGEANELIPVRRYLRRELGLAREQVDVQGYWKRGVVNLDHHAPLDETDPE